ncbi:2848_t:CDS:2 [Dentiscutata heterogama]|uniref:2848_t:CDS:1 n=1 Tax=Dentiscutata heterogama TaxID=1316150 RepID=A0ACA9LHH9_9GLOM|nr:2848_t:CDS:2 [Dentiscutata heterogama]
MTASYIYNRLLKWSSILYSDAAKDKAELAILKEFQYANAIIPTLSTGLPICPKDKLTSKLLNFKNLNSTIIDLTISDNY